MVEESETNGGWLVAMVAGGVIFLGALGAAGWFVAGGSGGAANLAGMVESEPYRPTSEWVEEGLDPDVTRFGFEGGEGGTGEVSPAIESSEGGELSEFALHNLMLQKQAEMMPCYVETLEQDPEASGKVDMRFGIAPDGHVALVRVTSSSLEDKPMEDCLVEASRHWSFPSTGRSTLMKFDTDFEFVTE